MANPYAPKPPGSSAPPRDHEDPPTGPPPDGQGSDAPASRPPERQKDGSRRRTPRTPVDPAIMVPLSRRIMLFALVLLACLLLSTAPLPWRMGSVALAAAALVLGGTALRRAWRAKVRGALIVAIAAGMAVSVTLGLATLAVIPVWDIEMARQTCMDGAITHSAQIGCFTDYRDALETYQDSLTG
ncbi:hypothetical protein [Sanguibacter antarcticus]|nr:hypothetical protein [Sanguibacter antarcticus]